MENLMLKLLLLMLVERHAPTAVGIQQEPAFELFMVPDSLWSAVPWHRLFKAAASRRTPKIWTHGTLSFWAFTVTSSACRIDGHVCATLLAAAVAR
jgi:hypothetical protein